MTRRGSTALLVDVVDSAGTRQLLEHIPGRSAPHAAQDVRAAAGLLGAAEMVVLQLQQPVPALLAAAQLATGSGTRLILGGALTAQAATHELHRRRPVVHADHPEAELLTGRPVRTVDDARAAATGLLDRGALLVALAVPARGHLRLWPDGEQLLRHPPAAVDPTGGGVAFIAGLGSGLRLG